MFREGESAIKGNLDDYAFMIYGLLELFEASFNVDYLKSALSLNKTLLNHFWDFETGGFYFTPDDGEELLIRKKEIYDGAIPSGNSIMMLNLLKLAQLTENEEFKKRGDELERAFSKTIQKVPTSFTGFLCAFDFKIGPSYEIVIAGKQGEHETDNFVDVIRHNFIPNRTLVLLENNEKTLELLKIIPSLKTKKMEHNHTTAYICLEGSCKAPTRDLNVYLKLLGIETGKN